ncbi:PREDICTED: tRNA-dihydrouridine(20a/20b) synthase [NAD(P)+]-like isoform X2 [Vollenhovia emeryi]|uniref:tRNA-dihydrouridine(20a/20b) synthase [NAD(P)+]-like isoform X2 n=1 Tax=Vollenhovia emeryi TaxID=411798 RepID=UPI0005F4B827|nr:PREDICTED: tRNA-dihydrouridine(20a/20b) synthase [NAD(P)+]-like isoform X2 [Vollenhovia emeryi]
MTTDVMETLKEPRMIKICAPMVRYSKLQFRTLVRRYGCDICFTPMILADSFVQSSKARDNEFTTHEDDQPLIVQFAAKTVNDFIDASEMVAPYCNGVDLNCGCPQRWAMQEGYGADLLKKPELVRDFVYQVRNRIPRPFTVSVKIRLLKDIRQTVALCQTLEKAGASFLTIHARTPEMRNEPIDLDSLKLLRDHVQLPLVANGDAKSLESAEFLFKESKCQGVMSARGILSNPALFSGYSATPLTCVQDWLDITSTIPTEFQCFHHHLVFMLEKILPRKDRVLFNSLQSKSSVLGFLESYYGVKPNASSPTELTRCNFNASRVRCKEKYIDCWEDDSSTDFLGCMFNADS